MSARPRCLHAILLFEHEGGANTFRVGLTEHLVFGPAMCLAARSKCGQAFSGSCHSSLERVVEPAIVDPDPSVLRGAHDIHIAMPEPDLGMLVGFSRVDRLRCNNILPGNHHGERDVGGIEILRGQPVEWALLVQHVEQRPAQGERGALVPQ
jgi:hypothetical protein